MDLARLCRILGHLRVSARCDFPKYIPRYYLLLIASVWELNLGRAADMLDRINTTAWTAGSTLLSLGLSAPQAMGCMVGVAIISALVAVLAGWPGSHLYLGFTVLCRASWGMRGGFWPVLNRIATSCVWMGIQAYWGGQGQSPCPLVSGSGSLSLGQVC